jgi:hypothetical protein
MKANNPDIHIEFKGQIFSKHFIDSKSLFLYHFGRLPSITIIRQVEHAKVWSLLQRDYQPIITEAYHYAAVGSKSKKEEKEESIILLGESLLLELGDGYCEFYFTPGFTNEALLEELMTKIGSMRGQSRSKAQEINLITRGDYGLELTRMNIKPTRLNLDLYYEDDFADLHKTILARLKRNDDKGIVLLHGLPGTGKTTYLRYLVGKIRKRVLFIPPDMASQIANPELIRLLVDNPNSVLIIEDAEGILMQRSPGIESNGVSNLLNISDGLLSDFLNVQIICTFNSSKAHVDSALLRKGRLIASYEFGKLNIAKAQKLSKHLGKDKTITEPLTLSEIVSSDEEDTVIEHRPVIGFKRA